MELYHLLNRGVDKRDIFLDRQDYARFVHDLYEFNDTKSAGSTYHSFQNLDLRSPEIKPRQERLVDIHAWCAMRNHYHLLLSERVEGGITQFIRKLNIGYAKYFNERYNRSGALFQGRTKKIHLENDPHFLYMLHYIHLNPLDYKADSKLWREGKVANIPNALTHLRNYQWSSYLDYMGIHNFPHLLSTGFFSEVFVDYKKDFTRFIDHMKSENLALPAIE